MCRLGLSLPFRDSARPGLRNSCCWRQSIERGFAFDPARGTDSADVRALDLKFASRRQELEQELRQGQPQLYALRAEAEQKRSALTPQFLRLAQTLEQAKANAKVA